MANVKVVLNKEAVREMLRSDEMQAILNEHGERVLEAAGPGYEISQHRGRNRVNTQVATYDAEAYYDNLRNNTLLKALGKG